MADGSGATGQSASAAIRDWQALHGSADLQFAPLPPYTPPPPPSWLVALGRFLKALFDPLGRALGLSWPVLEKLLIAAAVAAALFLLWRIVQPLLAGLRRRAPAHQPDWTPDRSPALALLDEADRLAREGRFDEATHLLLQRSIGEIAAARPEWLHPASTAREIAAYGSLPERARRAFAVIAARVERSRFALRPLAEGDWQAARQAYAEFALGWAQAAPAA
ncbi:MAG: hypothetical protein JF593_10035 [Novosphingobium sp.]|nr:hypothetical protein [Novosphingobium sp.]